MATSSVPFPARATIELARAVLLFLGILAGLFAVGFSTRMSWALAFWPVEDTPLSYLFVGAIAAAIAAATLWTSATGELGAAAAGALNLLIILAGTTASMLLGGTGEGAGAVRAAMWGVGAVLVLGFFLWTRRIPIRDRRPMPQLVRRSFYAFAAILALIGLALLLHIPGILPWVVLPQSSVLLGLIFLGNSVFFLYGTIQGRWHSAGGQLIGFLAYDAVLIGPLVGRIAVAPLSQLPALILYILVLVYSGLLAAYYFLINESTRLKLR